MKDLFKEIYDETIAALEMINVSKTEEEMKNAGDAYKQARAKLQNLKHGSLDVFLAYENSRNLGNAYLDFADAIQDENVEGLVKCLKEAGLKKFTFSSTWRNALKTAWLFKQNGCRMEGLVEINASPGDKAPAYCFSLE